MRKITLIFVMGIWVSVGCNKGQEEVGSKENTALLTEELVSEDDALLGRRDALFNMRQSLQAKRAALRTQRSSAIGEGGDAINFLKEEKALAEEETKLASLESQLFRREKEIASERKNFLKALSGAGKGSSVANNMSVRESTMAGREKRLAQRESELAIREATIAKREVGLASQWKESCSVGTTQTIIKTVDIKGTQYAKGDVEPLLQRARRERSKKGLLVSDLPQQAKGLEREAGAAMKEGDYGRARLAASQLVATIKAIEINKSFIAGKIGRLNQKMGSKRLTKNNEGLFRDATVYYGDGKFRKANSKLNKIYSNL